MTEKSVIVPGPALSAQAAAAPRVPYAGSFATERALRRAFANRWKMISTGMVRT
jgi:hypothetical protein